MAVPGGKEALQQLHLALQGLQPPPTWSPGYGTNPCPKGLTVTGNALVDNHPDLGYADSRTYALDGLDAADLSRSPREASVSEGTDYDEYRKRSADITMRGGTTSGIVYPLAVCEIARSFRLRNVGGTSAGSPRCAAAAGNWDAFASLWTCRPDRSRYYRRGSGPQCSAASPDWHRFRNG